MTTQVRVGRGYGVTLCVVADYGLVGNGAAMHVLTESLTASENARYTALCGLKGDPRSIEREVDARAVRIGRHDVCRNCLELMGEVEPPKQLKEPVDS